MFFGFSRKLRGLNRRKRNSRKRKRPHISKSHKKNVKKQNIRFKIEEIDETPTTHATNATNATNVTNATNATNTIKTIRTESLTPIVLSESRAQTQRKKTRSVKSRTPTPYPREYNSEDENLHPHHHVSAHQLNTSGDIILFFMNMLTTVKLYHWKTMNYATHKATDELYEDLNKYVDEFVEVMIGHKGGVRATLPRTNVKIYDCASKEEFTRKIEEYKEVLVGFTSRFGGKKNSDLLNIRDEILGALNKSLYVMSFK
jgi:hypothetical protein